MIDSNLIGRDYDSILMQSCADCQCDLIGMSEWQWWYTLPNAAKSQLPPLTFVHVDGRPYCEECRTEERFPPTLGREEYVPYRVTGMGA